LPPGGLCYECEGPNHDADDKGSTAVTQQWPLPRVSASQHP
jgi:hypothetical protein